MRGDQNSETFFFCRGGGGLKCIVALKKLVRVFERLKCCKLLNNLYLNKICIHFTEDEICGVSVSIRNQDVDILQVWNKKAALDEREITRVVEMVKEILQEIEVKTHFYKC